VLDSLWGKDEEVNELKQMLLTGSKIIVTTHSRKVSDLIATLPPYKLSVLSKDDCSTIFSQRAMTGIMLGNNHFSFYFQILSIKFVEIPAATHGVSPSFETIIQ
jgi:hypothetical protein